MSVMNRLLTANAREWAVYTITIGCAITQAVLIATGMHIDRFSAVLWPLLTAGWAFTSATQERGFLSRKPRTGKAKPS